MAKKQGRMKKWCEKYKQSGTRQLNKIEKGKKHQALVEHFVKRKEEGKTYEYKPNPYKEGTREWAEENAIRAEKNVDRRLPIQKTTSVFRKLDNELAEKEKEAKLRAQKKRA